ncbi:hypothetical protein [Wolbachia endosymbiont (group A) of Agelastica alni]
MLSVIAGFASNTKAVPRHWDPEKLIVHYTTFSIKSWIPDWNDRRGVLG